MLPSGKIQEYRIIKKYWYQQNEGKWCCPLTEANSKSREQPDAPGDKGRLLTSHGSGGWLEMGRRRGLQPQLQLRMGFKAVVVSAALLVAVSAQGIQQPKVHRLHVLSEVRNRYAKTLITSRVGNTADQAREISFDAVLPENAFISRFLIEMDNVTYEAYVRGKEEARQEYDAAVAEGRGAAHVAVSARDSNVVHVSVNVEAQKKVTFNLTYEELLQREIGAYNLRININPRQPVDDLAVEVRIEEQAPLRLVEVPRLQETNEILDTPDNATDPLARIERPTPLSAIVRWSPTKEEQRQRGEEGVSGQLVVRYDVDRDASPNQILVSEDGYFVHFYAPPGLPPLRKHVVFVLDVSGSMMGRKIEQLKTAMNTILDELNAGDVFSLIPFSTNVKVWHPDVPLTFRHWQPGVSSAFNASAIVEATSENIAKAKNSINSFEATGLTYMFTALKTALRVSDAGVHSGGGASSPGWRRHAPIIVLLTDGEPNGEVSDTDEIVRRITERNAESGAAIFTLAFGTGADYGFLRRLALRNSGVGRRIYEAADAHLQLRNFYRQIASPLLADVTFNYDGQQVDENSLTTVKFPTLFGGGELVVAGRLSSGTREPWCAVRSRDGNAASAVPAPAVVNVTSAERLWAYLTVRQLLDQDAATPNETLRTRAKDIALRYSFVTSVTSLVVVKPNATSAVNLDEPNAPGEDIPMSYDAARDLSFDDDDALDIDPDPVTEVVPTLADITWLGPLRNGSQVTLNINGTEQQLQLAENQTEGSFQNCTTPPGGSGVCRHLAACILPEFKERLDVFLSGYLCVVEGSFLGVCCPGATSVTPAA
ncbi:inter-alpha-trypsin inhibitor heavy chain H4-like isoform X8 [Schistocerca nitens]|uniref:inter-alpha-trypsin inhibitor heavy chain H4-like isoform X8 n=1 Tax=Schistocerca nitens TaxID=7011 RepID=UPI002118AB4D|nr:inter-alpha-trypsin inhibitor heavy chain H4-like isoform X8 [Schistocerca nitens]